MSGWFRVDADFVDHPKTRQLEQRLEMPQAGWFVMRAWSWLSRFSPTGQVRDRDVTTFERACEWSGSRGQLLEALVQVGFLDSTGDGGFEWHDWEEKQGKVAEKARKERDRKREYRARKKVEADAELSRGTTQGRPALRDGTERNETVQLPLSAEQPADRAADVFEHWRRVMSKGARTAFDVKRRKAVEARFADGYTAEDLCRAIDGCALTPHNMGLNDKSTRYDDIELICRDAAHVDRFVGQWRSKKRDIEPSRPDGDVFREVLEATRGSGDAQLPKQLAAFRWQRGDEGLVGVIDDPFQARWLIDRHGELLRSLSMSIDAPPLPQEVAA